MSIEREITVTLAWVEVGDDFNVELTTRDPLTMNEATVSLTWAQTVKLADELLSAVGEATVAVREDERQASSQGFDVAPICRECGEGKHGACDGQALVEMGDDVVVLPCGCAGVAHNVIDRAS